MAAETHGRGAAWVAAAIFVVVAGVQFYAVLHEALGADPPPASALIVAALTGLLALAAAAVLLVRVGYWREHVPFEVGRTGGRWVAYVSLGGAVLGFGGRWMPIGTSPARSTSSSRCWPSWSRAPSYLAHP